MKTYSLNTLFARMIGTFMVSIFIIAFVVTYLLMRENQTHFHASQQAQVVQQMVSALDWIETAGSRFSLNQRLHVLNRRGFQVRIAPFHEPISGELVFKSLAEDYLLAIQSSLNQNRRIDVSFYETGLQKQTDFPVKQVIGKKLRLQVQVQAKSGQWITLQTLIELHPSALPWNLILILSSVLMAICVVTLFVVRWVTRPLHALGKAARELGNNLYQPPLPVSGTIEIQEAAQAFNTMQLQLQTMVSEKAQFFSSISHDLKTPLTRLYLRAEVLDDRQKMSFKKDLKEMESLIETALLVLKDEGDEPDKQFSLETMLQTLVQDYAALGKQVSFSAVVNSSAFVGKPILFKRAISNLIENGLRYANAVLVFLNETSQNFEIRFEDDGPGIPVAFREKVFEPFFRGEFSRSAKTGGHGLGLSIVRKAVLVMGGEIQIERSETLGGCCFKLIFPHKGVS